MSVIRIQKKGQITIPGIIRSQLGLADGDLVEARVRAASIVLTAKVAIDRSRFPTADDEYTPEQRRIIDDRLAKSAEDIKEGRLYGPFDTADEMIASMKDQLKRRAAARKAKRSR